MLEGYPFVRYLKVGIQIRHQLAVAHGDERTSKVVGRAIEDIRLPKGTTIAAIVRGDDVIIAHHDTVIEAEDHVILFLMDKKRITEVERLFQVAVTFI